MDFVDMLFNAGRIVFDVEGGAEWKTSIVQTNSGREYRNAIWMYPLHSYESQDLIVGEEEAHYYRDFLNAVKGMQCGFPFKDWLDFKDDGCGIVNMSGAGTGQVTGQLHKFYAMGDAKSFRKISKPVASTVKVFIDGVEALGATVDATTGIVVFAPDEHGNFPSTTALLTWTGEFYVPVRFDSDRMPLSFRGAEVIQYGALGDKSFMLRAWKLREIKL